MTNFIEEQQKEARKKLTSPEKVVRDALGKTTDAIVTETITNTLNHILESGLLEGKTVKELYPEANTEVADHKLACQVFGKVRNNTLARDIKEFISNMDNKTGDN